MKKPSRREFLIGSLALAATAGAGLKIYNDIQTANEYGWNILKESKSAPDFTAETHKGEIVTLSKLSDQYDLVLLDFWAPYCGPCRRYLRDIDKLHKEYKEQGLKVIGVAYQTSPEQLEEFLRTTKVDCDIILDENGEIGKKYDVLWISTFYLIERGQMIYATKHSGVEELVEIVHDKIGD